MKRNFSFEMAKRNKICSRTHEEAIGRKQAKKANIDIIQFSCKKNVELLSFLFPQTRRLIPLCSGMITCQRPILNFAPRGKL
jgi:hypothetical protein